MGQAPPLFLTSRIPETEAYRSDRFETGFGFATRNRLAVGRTRNGRESFSYPHPGAAAHPYRKLALFHQVVPAMTTKSPKQSRAILANCSKKDHCPNSQQRALSFIAARRPTSRIIPDIGNNKGALNMTEG